MDQYSNLDPRFVNDPLAWKREGACRGLDPDLFYPEKNNTGAAAKRVCAGCPVRLECLEYAVATRCNDDHGIWGGTSEQERRAIRRRRSAERRRESAA